MTQVHSEDTLQRTVLSSGRVERRSGAVCLSYFPDPALRIAFCRQIVVLPDLSTRTVDLEIILKDTRDRVARLCPSQETGSTCFVSQEDNLHVLE